MKRSINSLTGFSMGAVDGEIGEVKAFYFDDHSWIIRYLVVETGSWLAGRKVLISPFALTGVDMENETFPVNLTREQIKNSPDVDTEMTVSRQEELNLYNHYGWPYDNVTGMGFYGGWGFAGMIDARVPLEDQIAIQNMQEHPEDANLRSNKEVKGYTIHAVDGEIGDVEDFIIDDESWVIHFIVVDTGKWLPGKKVLISPKWISEIKWATSEVFVAHTIDAVKNSPEYDPEAALQEVYETTLNEHYNKYKNI
jgi:uncharacterized protein YrrD